MSYELRGWTEVVVEVALEGDQSAAKLGGLIADGPPGAAFLTALPPTGGGATLGAMVEGQWESVLYVRIACPAGALAFSMGLLQELAEQVSPRPPAG